MDNNRVTMVPYAFKLNDFAKDNTNYRQVIWTGKNLQMTIMSIPIRGDIGLEIHPDTDQIICVEDGRARAIISRVQNRIEQQYLLEKGDVIFIPQGYYHNIINNSNVPLKLASVYAPPHHKPNVIQKTKEEAMKEEKY